MECSFPGEKRQPDEKEHLERGWGIRRAPGKCKCHKCSAPALPPVLARLEGGRERAEPEGQQLMVPLGLPFPQPPCRNSTHASLPGLAASDPPAARSHHSKPAEAGAPRDVTRGAAKGRGPRFPDPRGGNSHAQCPRGRPSSLKSRWGCTKRKSNEGAKGKKSVRGR